jgi:hypothetical protein
MTPAFTILMAHKLNPRNNDALAICLDMLTRNTSHDYALLMSAAADQNLFATMNRLVQEAPTDCCIFMHSDMFVARGWDSALLSAYDANTFVTGLLVEPGAMGLHHNNVHMDFGRRPEVFRRAEFETWAANNPPAPRGEGWYAPYMFSRETWLRNGGHDMNDPRAGHNWSPLDMDMFERFKASGGQVRCAQAVVYHLQRWSETEEQEAAKRL